MARKQALRRSESPHRSLFEDLPDAMLVSDTKGRILRVNFQAEALFGYSRKELIGQSIDLLVPDGHRDSHADHRAGYHAAPQIRPMGLGKDLHARRKDGSELKKTNLVFNSYLENSISDYKYKIGRASCRERV